MSEQTRGEEARQLANWESLVRRVVDHHKARSRIKTVLGSTEDMRQVARVAVLQAIRSGSFADARNKSSYLSRIIYYKLIDAVRDSMFIRLPDHNAATNLVRAEAIGAVDRSGEAARQAMRLGLLSDMDKGIAASPVAEAGPASLRATCDVGWAVSRLPATIRKIMGHTFGIAGYDKLAPDDLAHRLGIATSTVRREAYEGRRLLKRLLKDCGYTEAVDE